MPRPPFWVFSLAGFFFFGPSFCLDYPFGFQSIGLSFLFFFLFFLMSLISWLNELFLGIFCLPFFLSLSHFDALSRLLSCLNALVPFCAWWIFSFFDELSFGWTFYSSWHDEFQVLQTWCTFCFLSHWWNFISLSLIEWKLIFL